MPAPEVWTVLNRKGTPTQKPSGMIRSIEKGARMGELRAFLSAGDPQRLPEPVEGFLTATEQRASACVCKGTALLVECLSPQIAEVIAQNSQTAKLCQRIGERGVVG